MHSKYSKSGSEILVDDLGNTFGSDYQLYLYLPDPEPALHDRSEYAVRLANLNCWEESTGYNDLGVKIRIDSSIVLPQSHSKIKLYEKIK